MNIQGIQSAMVGFALFDMWDAAFAKTIHSQQKGDPLIAAVTQAFESYLGTQNAVHQAQIASVATYALTPKGGAQMISQQQMAPLLALNVMA